MVSVSQTSTGKVTEMSWTKVWTGIEKSTGDPQVNRISGDDGSSKHTHDYYTWGADGCKEGSVGENAERSSDDD
jgi:hypothetical protein